MVAHCNSNLCRKKGYCEMGGYCKKVNPKIREELLETTKPNAIEVEIFKSKGSGINCETT